MSHHSSAPAPGRHGFTRHDIAPHVLDAALSARVPGGAKVSDWLPSADDRGQVPHAVAREVMASAITAVFDVANDMGMVKAVDINAADDLVQVEVVCSGYLAALSDAGHAARAAGNTHGAKKLSELHTLLATTAVFRRAP